MPANVETMFSVRETPWHGLGRIIMDAPASREALELAGLDWQVESRNIYSGTGSMIPGYRANVRSTDDAVLGVVSDRYRIVQNEEAFQFTDDCWVKVLLTKLPVLCRAAKKSGCWQASEEISYRWRSNSTISCNLQQS